MRLLIRRFTRTRSWSGGRLRRPIADGKLEPDGFGSDPKRRAVGQRHRAVDAFARHPGAVLAPEIVDRDLASDHSQLRVASRDRVRIDLNGAAPVAANHGLAGGDLD